MITEEKIHAHKANEARRLQILTFEEELQWADRKSPTPRLYPQTHMSLTVRLQILISGLNFKQFLP